MDIKSINVCVLMPAVIKPDVMHVARENATFVPTRLKVDFRAFKPMEGEDMCNNNSFCL